MAEFLTYVDRIKEHCEEGPTIRGKRTVRVVDKYVYFWRGNDGKYLDGLQYISHGDILWSWSNPKEFYDKFVNGSHDLRFELVSFRNYGQPKLKKPAELKGIKQAFSIDYIPKKCKCSVFVNGDDVWIKHADYFSETMELPPEESGAPLDYLTQKYVGSEKAKKFIYGDAWGSIVLRNEAWICLRNVRYWLRDYDENTLTITQKLLRQQERLHGWGDYSLVNTYMERFIERVIGEVHSQQEAV